MNWSILLLALIQGLTEFIPVSSSGHLVLAEHFFRMQPSEHLGLLVWLHLATLFSIVLFMPGKLLTLLRSSFLPLLRAFFWSLLGTGMVFVLLSSVLKALFDSSLTVYFGFLISSLFLFSASLFEIKREKWEALPAWQFFLIGVFQGIAILPGISRSGSVFFASRIFGLAPSAAVEYSLLLSLPTIFAAVVQQWHNVAIFYPPVQLAVTFLFTLFTGLLGIFGLNLLGRGRWAPLPFALYCFTLGSFGLASAFLYETH
ncbi:MAG: undecaprenyl-diphosphate phosphatase [bacterium JZ-2024 1]